MKRILVSLIAASGLAFMAAAPANAANALCGHSWAMLMQGTAPTTIDADGSASQPGWLTAAVGVGEITFNALGTNGANGCTASQGEVIFNQGDIQTNPAGEYFGPGNCYDGDSFLGTGLPCFDGGNDLAVTPAPEVTSPGVNGHGSMDLTFTANFDWYDTSLASNSVPFAFTVQPAGSTTFTGLSVPAPGDPVLVITMQRISLTPVPTAYGTAPYLGASSVSCGAYGANETDLVANGQDYGLAGGFQAVSGAIQIFNATQAGGAIGFNGNDDLTGSAATSTPANNDCSISIFPGDAEPTYSSGTPSVTGSEFADGASNSFALIDEPNTGSSCTDQNTAGAGYANASVSWGSKDQNTYITTVGLASGATGFVPPGGMSTCTTYSTVPAGKLTGSISATAAINRTSNGIPALGYLIQSTNTSPADCQVSVTMASASDSLCSLSLTAGTGDNPGDIAKVTQGTVNCSCAKLDSQCTAAGVPDACCTGLAKGTCPADEVSSSITLTSANCPVSSGGGPQSVTCKQ